MICNIKLLDPGYLAFALRAQRDSGMTLSRVTPTSAWRVMSVHLLDDYRLKVIFNDGTEGIVNMHGLIFGANPGLFSALRDENVFKKVYIDLGVVTWPGEIDLAPDAMYDAIKKYGEWSLS